ncbi:uncharacterized protein LOC119443354 [Dermacentor silvarum]|uniref:uncharacterized protein LOC119442342 n=1 Tax=Dermacentor silvarum TaxID=543639 RepID=UPI001897ABA7|nr:uncharacterized protein LOC119442342 [Dermacentor silvarum]XP_037564314.1 uncharacterized protein LOC119443354 [Dermacentor silvarum]
MLPALHRSGGCRLLFAASSTAAEVAGLHLATDLLVENPPDSPAVILCDSRTALLALRRPEAASLGVALLAVKIRALVSSGLKLSLQWLPSHVGVQGNEEANALVKAAHHAPVPVSTAVTAFDYTRRMLQQHLTARHPDQRVASGRPPRPLPDRGLTMQERSLLLRHRIGCSWTAFRKHSKGLAPSPAGSSCGEEETIDHLLCFCPAFSKETASLYTSFRRLGLPTDAESQLLFPGRPHGSAFRHLLTFLEDTGLSCKL